MAWAGLAGTLLLNVWQFELGVCWHPPVSQADSHACLLATLPAFRMGFNDQEIVALSGAHTLGRCHADRSGFVGPWTNGEQVEGGSACLVPL